MPFEVPVRELVEQKLLTAADLGAFAELSATVRLVPASNPQSVMMWAELPKGLQLLLLADGSVQQGRGAVVSAANTSVYTRQILVPNPESLRKVPGLDPAKPIPELLSEYLKKNGVELQPPASAVFDEKTKVLQVRATLLDLDRIEKLASQLQPDH